MPTPLQGKPLARIQPAQQELPSLEEMRAQLLELENDTTQPPLVRMIFGIQRTLTDHMRLMVGGHQVQTQTIKRYIADGHAALLSEVQNLLSAQPDAESAVNQAEPPIVPEVVVDPPSAAEQRPSPNAPQMTVTPKPPKKNRGAGQ